MPTRKKPVRARRAAPKREPIVEIPNIQASDPLPSVYSPENIEARQKAFEEKTSGAHVITDEWYGQIETANPFDTTAKPFQDDNPDKHFRYLSKRDAVVQRRGKRDYKEVRDKQGRAVEVAGMPLAWIPRHVHEARVRKNIEAAEYALESSKERFEEAQRVASFESGGAIRAMKNQDEAFDGARNA